MLQKANLLALDGRAERKVECMYDKIVCPPGSMILQPPRIQRGKVCEGLSNEKKELEN